MISVMVHFSTVRCWGLLLLMSMTGCSSIPSWGPFRASAPPLVSWESATPQQRLLELRASVRQAEVASPEELAAAAERLVHRFRNERDPILRQEIVRTMGFIKTPEINEGLQMASQDRDPVIRQAACRAWANIGGNPAVKALATRLQVDSDVDVRLAAARALGQVPDPLTVKTLGETLTDKDPAVQLRAMQSLQLATGQEISLDIDKWQAYVAAQAASDSKLEDEEAARVATKPSASVTP